MCSFFLSILLTSHVSSSASSNVYSKDSLILQKEGLRLHHPYYLSRTQWCNYPITQYHTVAVFYDIPHLQRLELLGSSYNGFVKDVVIPAIVSYCGDSVDAKNINIVLEMYKTASNQDTKEPIESKPFIWDGMYFISRPSGITYTKYQPFNATSHLSQDQIQALRPAAQKKAFEAQIQEYRKRIAKQEARDDAARKANNGYNSCKYGCITLCNKTNKTYTITTAHLQSATTRGNKSGIARVEIEGWWELKPEQCYKPQAALYWQTYYSIAHKSPNGKWIYPQWDVDQAVLNGSKGKGMSGYRNGFLCIKKSDHFRRFVPGSIKSAFKEACPKGYQKAPVNLFTEGQVDYDLTYTLK